MTQEELDRSYTGLSRALLREAGVKPEKRCDWSDLMVAHCAHCLGHVADFPTDNYQRDEVYG